MQRCGRGAMTMLLYIHPRQVRTSGLEAAIFGHIHTQNMMYNLDRPMGLCVHVDKHISCPCIVSRYSKLPEGS